MNRIFIEKVRGIGKLEFIFPSGWGTAYLLTGANGSGKSTLLSCIGRLGYEHLLGRTFKLNILFRDADA